MKTRTLITLGASALVLAAAGIAYMNFKKNLGKKETANDNGEVNTNTEPVNDTETTGDATVETNDEVDTVFEEFAQYLFEHSIDTHEIMSICETILLIKDNRAEDYINVREKMISIINSEFDIETTMAFDKENFKLMYGDMDIKQLIFEHGFQIISMGVDALVGLTYLYSALINMQATNMSEVAGVVYDIYHLLKDPTIDYTDPETYDKYFKKYVDQYVDVKNDEPVQTDDTPVSSIDNNDSDDHSQSTEQVITHNDAVDTKNILSFKEVE